MELRHQKFLDISSYGAWPLRFNCLSESVGEFRKNLMLVIILGYAHRLARGSSKRYRNLRSVW